MKLEETPPCRRRYAAATRRAKALAPAQKGNLPYRYGCEAGEADDHRMQGETAVP